MTECEEKIRQFLDEKDYVKSKEAFLWDELQELQRQEDLLDRVIRTLINDELLKNRDKKENN